MTQEQPQTICRYCQKPCKVYVSRSRIFGLLYLSSCCRAVLREG
jgi:hypothetical protein